MSGSVRPDMLRLGLGGRLGGRCVFASELDAAAAATYRLNWEQAADRGGELVEGDVLDVAPRPPASPQATPPRSPGTTASSRRHQAASAGPSGPPSPLTSGR